MQPLLLADFERARRNVSAHAHHTPLLSSRLLSERCGFEVKLKAEMFQRTGSYKIRGPLNKFQLLTEEQKHRGVICSSAGNHAQGVALAAAIHQMKAVVCMATNATPSKIEATRGYGAQVVLHGSIWDDADAHARDLVERHGYIYIHPFDDPELIAGQGTIGLEIYQDWPEVEVVVVPIGGGGLISGTAMALKARNPNVRVFGVESSGAPGMQQSVAAGHVVTLEKVDCVIDGLRVKRVGENTRWVVSRFVESVVVLPDRAIFDAMLWIMHHCKLVVEGAAAAPVAALLAGLIPVRAGSKVACILSGGNVNLEQLRSLAWN